MNTINKKLAFPSSLHWVALIGKTTPFNFIQDFGFRNTNIRFLTSKSTISPLEIKEPVDCFSVEVSTIIAKHPPKRLMADLNKLAIEKHCPIFCFSMNYEARGLCEEPNIFTYLTYNEQIKGGCIWKSQGHPTGLYTLEPRPNAKEEALKESPSDDSVYDQAPTPKTAETTIKIKDLSQTSRGFHKTTILSCNANALLRSQKTDTIVSLAHNVQKGDYIVFDVVTDCFHPIKSTVWEVTFVSNIPNSTQPEGFGQAALSLTRIANATYHRGGIDDKYIDECIVFNDNRKD